MMTCAATAAGESNGEEESWEKLEAASEESDSGVVSCDTPPDTRKVGHDTLDTSKVGHDTPDTQGSS